MSASMPAMEPFTAIISGSKVLGLDLRPFYEELMVGWLDGWIDFR
jgi:hypothetical protein